MDQATVKVASLVRWYVHFRVTSSRCQRSNVAGVMMKHDQRSLGMMRAAAVRDSLSSGRARLKGKWRSNGEVFADKGSFNENINI